ncbi:MAG: hypothetical protein ACKVXR_06450 [Planctomycetota bacterium]
MNRSAPAFALLGLACALPGGCGDGRSGTSVASFAAPEPQEPSLAADDRIAWLLAPCARPEPFLGDTSDPVAILVHKMARGHLDPMRLAKSELSALGEAALPELRRFCEAQLSDPDGAQRLLNGLTVLSAMKTDAGREILLTALGHPQDTVRIEAVRGLAVHAGPEDYDRLKNLIPISEPGTQNEIGAALIRADRQRAEDDFVAWLAGPREHAAVWIDAARKFCDTQRPETLERFRSLAPRLEGESRFYLEAALAKNGDEAALASLRAALADSDPAQRNAAIRAFERVGMIREIAPLLWSDRNETLRGLVAAAIAQMPRTAETDAWLRKGSLDRARSVQLACLRVLAERGDLEAFEQAMVMLEGNRADLEFGVHILKGAWRVNPQFAQRSFALLEGLRTGTIQPVRVEPQTLDRAIAQIPLLQAAAALHDRGRTTSGMVDSLPAHRWYVMQAGNTCAEGRALLRVLWEEEEDPAWRVDLVGASAFEKDEPSRQFLLSILDLERTTPLEMLHAANLLVHHGPTSVVAPRLKRAVMRVTDPAVRQALNCLLNEWYGVAD